MAAAAILNFENRLPFHNYWTNPHQILWECWKFAIELNWYIKNTTKYLPKFKMVAAAILNFENLLPFVYYQINPHQIWGECWKSDIERNCYIKICIFTKFKDGGGHLEFRKSFAISLLLDQSSPNLVGMLRIWKKTRMLHWICIHTGIQDGGRCHLEFRKSVAISF